MGFSRKFSIVAAYSTVLAWANPVAAQCLLCQTGQNAPATIVTEDANERPLHVEVAATLDFARLIAGQSGGTVRVDPQGGGVVTSGNVRAAAGLAFTGRIIITGTPRRMVRIDLPDVATLSSATGGTLRLSAISTGRAPVLHIGADGRLDIAFGGQLELDGAADGDFRGRIPVSVSYE